jgi:two-component system chemotaxis sensor kinase CheA
VNRENSVLLEFAQEAEELIEVLHQNLQSIGTVTAETQVRPETINAIFRAAHTMKGMAGMAGLPQISHLSHNLEELLDDVRLGKRSFTEEICEVLTDGTHLLHTMIEYALAGRDEPASTLFEKRILSILQETTEAPEAALLEGIDLDRTVLSLMTEYECHRLFETIKLKKILFEVSAIFNLESFDTDLSALSKKLQKRGEIITTLPETGSVDEGEIGFCLLVGCPSKTLSLRLRTRAGAGQIRSRKLSRAKPRKPKASLRSSKLKSDKRLQPDIGNAVQSLTPTVRVDIEQLDGLLTLAGELVLSKTAISHISKELLEETGFTRLSNDLLKASQALEKRITEFHERLLEVRMVPIGQIFDRLVRTVRRLSKDLGKEVNLLISGEETKMDKSMVEDLTGPLLHLISNALDHGMESREERIKADKPEVGTIYLRARQKGNHVVIELEDDGRGIDTESTYMKALQRGLIDPNKEYSERDRINLLFLPGFSTRDQVTEISGRGVGLDVVAKYISRLSGLVSVETIRGQGTLFTLTFPITLTIVKALIVHGGTETFAIPLNAVSESLMISAKDIRKSEEGEVIQLREDILPLVRLTELFSLQEGHTDDRRYVVVVGSAEKRVGLVVNMIEGQKEIVIKPLGGILKGIKGIKGISGATELGDRRTILVLDVAALMEESSSFVSSHLESNPRPSDKKGESLV